MQWTCYFPDLWGQLHLHRRVFSSTSLFHRCQLQRPQVDLSHQSFPVRIWLLWSPFYSGHSPCCPCTNRTHHRRHQLPTCPESNRSSNRPNFHRQELAAIFCWSGGSRGRRVPSQQLPLSEILPQINRPALASDLYCQNIFYEPTLVILSFPL